MATQIVAKRYMHTGFAETGRETSRFDGPNPETRRQTRVRDDAVEQRAAVRVQAAWHRQPVQWSIRIFPAGDGWTTDPRLARFVRGDLPVAEFLESVSEQLDFALVDSVRRSMAAQPRMSVPAGSWKASRRDVPNPSPVVEESSGPRLADVRGRNKLYRIDMAHASVAIGFMMRRSREVPCILVSLPADRPEPYLDVDALLDEIGDDAAVLQIVDHETDEWLNSRLPEQLRAMTARAVSCLRTSGGSVPDYAV